MSKKPISEKTSEILFNHYFLRAFRLGEISVYAPSSVEEFKNGYDSKLIGLSSFRELYLQYKAPIYSENKRHFTIKVTKHQHRMLKQYPDHTAYYVAHTFTSLKDILDAQKKLRISINFLKYFVAIEISSLPEEITFFQYSQPSSHRESLRIRYKKTSDGNCRIASNKIVGSACLRGNQLAEKFKNHCIGTLVQLPKDFDYQDVRHSVFDLTENHKVHDNFMWQMTPLKAQVMADGCSKTDFGIHLRKELMYTNDI